MTIADAKTALPLPALMGREGMAAHAKKSARCPFHDDQRNSFSVYRNGNGGFHWKCFSGCGDGDEIDFLEKLKGISQRDATKLYIELAGGGTNGNRHIVGVRTSPDKRATGHALEFDWQACLKALTEEHRVQLAEERGYSDAYIAWLYGRKLIGLYDGCVAFPVHDQAGTVVACHYRLLGKDKNKWRYFPTGLQPTPLIVGDLGTALEVHVFESQWDMFAVADKFGWHEKEGVALISTRGASNTACVAALVPASATLYLWPQNDGPGREWADAIVSTVTATVRRVITPAPFKDVNEWTWNGDSGASAAELEAAMEAATTAQAEQPRPLIEFRSPLQLKNFVPPPGMLLVGDYHIVKGSVFVTAGAPGVGKSRATVALAEAGATRREWFGLPVHRRFKTMIVQAENGEYRLAREFADLDCETLEGYVLVCPPPPFGLCFSREDFRAQLAAAIAKFEPDVVIFDPWNAVAREQDQKEYLASFETIKSVLPRGDDAPALGIVAHTRKPKTDERASGRALLNLIAGSYVLGSVPRSVFVMQAASDETTDNRVVWTCCKNNDGDLGPRSAWERQNGLFSPVTDFEWDKFDAPEKSGQREVITEADLRAAFETGGLTKIEAREALEETTGASRASIYRALNPKGRFAKILKFEKGKIGLR